MGFFEELKRRNVFRVGIAYTVGSWLLLQITDVLMSMLGLPIATGKVVLLLLVIGFLPALIFAWAFEITPEGLKRDKEVDPRKSIAHLTAGKLDKVTLVMVAAVVVLVVVDRVIPEEASTWMMPVSPFAQESDTRPVRGESTFSRFSLFKMPCSFRGAIFI